MRIPEQLGSSADDMQVDQGEENADAALDKKDHQPTQCCLNIEISDSFLTSVRLMLAWERNAFLQIKYNDEIKYEELTAAQNHLTSGRNYKRISTELPLLTLTIGNKKFIRKCDCKILASFCYVTQLVVCKLCYEKLTRRVDIPFPNITSLRVCFDERGFDTLRIEARSSLEYFSADKPRPGMFTSWEVDHSKEDDSFPESRSVFLEIEKGMLEKGLAKLLYMDPRLQHTVEFARASDDQRMYQQGRVHAHMQQTNMSVLHPLLSVNSLPFIGGRM